MIAAADQSRTDALHHATDGTHYVTAPCPGRALTTRSLRSLLTRTFLALCVAIIFFEHILDIVLLPILNLTGLVSTLAVAVFTLGCIGIAAGFLSGRIARATEATRQEREIALEALRTSEKKYRNLVDYSLVGVFKTNIQGQILYANDALAKLLEFDSPSDLMQVAVTCMYKNAEDRERLVEALLQHGSVTGFELEQRTKTGRVIHVLLNAVLEGQELSGMMLDITSRKQAEERLQDVARQQRALLDNNPDIAWLKDSESRLIAVNEPYGKACGMAPGNLVGKTDFDIWPREMALRYQTDDRDVMVSGKRKIFEEPLSDREGNIAWFETIKTPIFNEQGAVIGTTGIARDITARKQAETAIREANDRFKAVLESISSLVYVADMQTHEILFVNKYGRDVFGDVVGKLCYASLQSNQHGPCDFCSNDKLLTESGQPGGVFTWEFQNISNGRWYHIQDRAIRWTEGRVVRMEIATDITDRKQTEKKLLETERRFREILENLKLVAIALDADGNITFCNDFMLDLTGYSREEVSGENWFDLFVPDNDEIRDTFQQTIRSGSTPLYYQHPIVTKKGERRIISWNNTLLRDPDGTILGIAGIGEDITERKELEAKLLHSQKMESIGTLAGGVAHDLNNVLTTIGGFGNILNKKMDKDSPLKMYVEQIMDAADNASKIIRSLLAIGRKQIMNLRVYDVNKVIRKSSKLLETIIGENNEYVMELTKGPLHVLLDVAQIEQVFMNIASNARDAMPDGGRMTIRTRQINLGKDFTKSHGYGKPGDYVLISVSDDGIGIADKELERIFEPFFTTKELYKGTGLGLSMVYGIVKSHSGYITVTSELNRGTTVNIYLPLATDCSLPEVESNDLPSAARTESGISAAQDDGQISPRTSRLHGSSYLSATTFPSSSENPSRSAA